MIKRILLVVVIVCALCFAGCSEQQMTTTLMSGQDTDLVARLGVRRGDTEIGGVIKYAVADTVTWGPEPDFGGGYIIFHLTQDVTMEDTPSPSPLQPFLEALHARPYAGVELVADCDTSVDNVQPNWVFGTSFTLTEDNPWALVVEYCDGDQAAGDLFIGGQILF